MGATTIEYIKNGARVTSFIEGTASLEDSVALALSLSAYTNAGVSRVGFTVAENNAIVAEVSNEDFETVSYFAVIFFRDADRAIHKLVIPAPKKTQYELKGKSLKLMKTHGDALAAVLGANIGKTLSFMHGGVTSAYD